MCTKMMDADWANALKVFCASLPRRGAKGRNDRLFLEALHYFSVHNITWRALPERFGKWNSAWKRFDRFEQDRCRRDVLRASCRAVLVGASGADVRFDGGPRPCLGSGRKRGQENQALGRSRGGFSTKIHMKTDFDGHPIAFDLTDGEKGDAPHFPILLGLGPDNDPRRGDRRQGLCQQGQQASGAGFVAIPIVPHKANEKGKRASSLPRAPPTAGGQRSYGAGDLGD